MAHFLAKPGFLLARIDQISTAIFSGRSNTETLAQAEFLMLLDTLGAVPQISLARAAGVDKSTTAYVLDNLSARGWIERNPCVDDRRRSLVSVAPDGKARLDRIRADYAVLQDQLEMAIDPGDRADLIATLFRLGGNPDSPAPPWTPSGDPERKTIDKTLSFLMRRALQHFQAHFLACTAALNITLRQFSLLFILSQRESVTQTSYARMFGIDPSTCAVIMRGLTTRGLITSAPSPLDGRERVYRIAAQGRLVLDQALALAEQSERLVFGGEAVGQLPWLVGQLRAIVKAHSGILRFPGAISSL
jgi:DNA-binding MarR family transcriptional regulator